MNLSWGLFSNVCNGCIPNLASFLFLFGIILAIGFWIYKLVTHDWTQYDKNNDDDPF